MQNNSLFLSLLTVFAPVLTDAAAQQRFTQITHTLTDRDALRLYGYLLANPHQLSTIWSESVHIQHMLEQRIPAQEISDFLLKQTEVSAAKT